MSEVKFVEGQECLWDETYVKESDYRAALAREAALREEMANHDSASLLINSWVAEHKSQMPWDKAIELIAIVTKMPQEEKQRLLCLDDQYELMQQRLTAAEQRNTELERALSGLLFEFDDGVNGGRDDVVPALDYARTLTGGIEFKPTESGAGE